MSFCFYYLFYFNERRGEINFDKEKQIIVGTHDGNFHGDDVMCFAMLQLAFGIKTILIRTRDPGLLAKADIVFDVGDVYDPEKNIFDHHFVNYPIRDNGVPYSSAGLIWKHYGIYILRKHLSLKEEEEYEKILDRIDKTIIQSIDAHDTGHLLSREEFHYTISQAISSYALSWEEYEYKEKTERKEYLYFKKAASMARTILLNNIKQQEAILNAEKDILDMYMKSGKPKVLVLENNPPFEGCFLRHNLKSEYVVSSVRNGELWHIHPAPFYVGKNVQRFLLPISWAGKRGHDLEKTCGIKGALFCHAHRFIAGARHLQGAIKMANQALKEKYTFDP